jgi:hypothetical protein
LIAGEIVQQLVAELWLHVSIEEDLIVGNGT